MRSRRLVFVLLISLIAAVIAAVATYNLVSKRIEMSRQELITEAQSGFVHEIVVTDGEVITGESTKRGPFRMRLKRDDKALIETLSALGVTVKYETEPLGLI
jgi:hypothetical protein